jgi:hypothetical protein
MADIEAVQKVLGEPFVEELNDEHRRTRRNLLVVASGAIFYGAYDLQVTEFSLLGTKLSTLPPEAVGIAVFILLLYLVTNFGWKSWDHFQHLKIRLTGSKAGRMRGSFFGNEDDDTPDDPRNSSLYAWWSQRVGAIADYSSIAENLQQTALRLEEWAGEGRNAEMPNINHVATHASGISTIGNDLKNKIDAATKIIESHRVPVSLERFDKSFWRYQSSQIWRMLMLELGLPLFLGLAGLWLAFPKELLE